MQTFAMEMGGKLANYEEEVDEPFLKQIKKPSQLQALILMGNCSHLNMSWKCNRMGQKQPRRLLGYIIDNILMQILVKLTMGKFCCMCR